HALPLPSFPPRRSSDLVRRARAARVSRARRAAARDRLSLRHPRSVEPHRHRSRDGAHGGRGARRATLAHARAAAGNACPGTGGEGAVERTHPARRGGRAVIRMLVAAALVALLATCTGSAAPRSRAQRIGKLEEAIGGPHALGRVGDYILEHDQVRFVIADTGRCPPGSSADCVEVYGRVNTTYGGTLVDADLQRIGGDGTGNDQLAELLPGFFFTAIDPTEVRVTADGSDGRAAEVTVRGTGGDLFQM